jgi:hypothetical protein
MHAASYALQHDMSSPKFPEPKKTLFTDYPPDLVKYKPGADIDRQAEHYIPTPFPYHHTSSSRLVRAAANSPRSTNQVPPRKSVPTRTEFEDNLEATTYTTWNTSGRPAPVEGKNYTSHPQTLRPLTDHRFSQFLGDGVVKNDHEDEDIEARRSNLHLFETVAKKTLKSVKKIVKTWEARAQMKRRG